MASLVPPMTLDALPYDMFRRVAACLESGDKAQLSRVDVKRVVLSFCLWERTPIAEGGGLAPMPPPPGGEGAGDGENGESKTASGNSEDHDGPLGAPIYRFLNPCGGREAEGGVQSNGSTRAKTVLASYPRSGNSLLRRLLEEITGTITGSDTRPDRTLSRSLSVFGMQGEGVVDHRVQVVKTHFPERLGFRAFEGDRAILLVRNPFDAIDSYFNMALTNTHDQSLHECVYEEFSEFWDGMARNEMKVWERFHLFWLSRRVPVHVVRYEDLVGTPERTLTGIISFLYDDMSAGDVAKTYGDRIRHAPAVVNATRAKSGVRVAPARGAAAATTAIADAESRAGSAITSSNSGSARPYEGADGGVATASGGGERSTLIDSGETTACGRVHQKVRDYHASAGAKDGDGEAEDANSGGPAAAAANGGVDSDVLAVNGEVVARSAGAGLYRPRTSGRGVRGSLRRRYTNDQVTWCVREIGTLLRRLGYDPLSQGFPPAANADLLKLDRLQSLYAGDAGVTCREGGRNTGTNKGSSVGEDEARRPPEHAQVLPAQPEAAGKRSTANATTTIIVNDRATAAAAAVRDARDAYGRAMTPFRRSHTQRDTQPLPLRGEDRKAQEWQRQQRRRRQQAAAVGS